MLGDIFRRHRVRILVCYALLVIEFSIFAFLPFLMGKAVDHLINGLWDTYHLFLGVSVFALIAGFTRRRFDNRAFLWMWSIKATAVVIDLIKKNIDRTKIVSRSYMIKEFAHFLEFTVPAFVSAVVDMSVALVMLWLFVPHLRIVLTLLLIVAVVLCYVLSVYMTRQEVICQHDREQIADAIMSDDLHAVEKRYEQHRRNNVRLADYDGFTWGSLDVLSTSAVLIVIAASARDGCSAGIIMANLVYCQKLFEKSCFVSQFFRHLQQLRTWTAFLTCEDGAKIR